MSKNELDINHLQSNDKLKKHEILESFISENLNFIKSIASKILTTGKVPPCIEFDDLVSWGIEGLIKAKKNFNKDFKTKFQTYAFYRIRGEIMDRIRHEWKYRLPKDYQERKKKLQNKLVSFIKDSIDQEVPSSENSLFDIIEKASFVHFLNSEFGDLETKQKGMKNPEIEQVDESHDYIWKEIESLDDDEKLIIDLFYVKGMKQYEIAEYLNLSKSRVCRIHIQGLEKLKNKFKYLNIETGEMEYT